MASPRSDTSLQPAGLPAGAEGERAPLGEAVPTVMPGGGRLDVERVVGSVRGGVPGPTLIVVGGIHGNEPAGILAARRVLARLRSSGITLAGEMVAFAGNVGALAQGKRYEVKDLNRQWTAERLRLLDERAPELDDAEDREQRALRAAIEEALGRARGPVYLLDLHTTSAAGIPFALLGDTLRHRAFAMHFPLPAILGLEELVDGVLVEWLTGRGCVTMVIEAGQHADPASVDHLEAALWLALDAAGLVDGRKLPELEPARARLLRARGDLPHVMEVLSRHAVEPEHVFRMEPGFANIGRTYAGQLLARDRRGEIRAPRDGLLFMPLYQGQGQDGFFLGREVGPWRIALSRWVRQLGLERLLPLLPGVRRDPRRKDVLHVDTRIAHFYPLDVFHIFGFRKIRKEGAHLEVARRPH